MWKHNLRFDVKIRRFIQDIWYSMLADRDHMLLWPVHIDRLLLREKSSPVHNGPAVNQDAPVVKIFHVVATGAQYPKFEFENHKNQYFSWLLRSEHVKTNIFGNHMTKMTI